ncbi:hypothetical protein KJ707_01645 [Patescibacteria group bacterium]|nr:hypothetical protein [Patescibacteria group bacterium]MBU1967300.1 hypothetical protein [Patescibacteria group bacterium]MBU2543255.1 hypothetical protein [Patescibacteria group bacterium]
MSPLNIPKSTQKLFWSCDPSTLDSEDHKEYIVHQILQYGDLSDFEWLKKQYSQNEIKYMFINKPRPTYQPKTYNFIENFLLQISEPIEAKNYVRSAHSLCR